MAPLSRVVAITQALGVGEVQHCLNTLPNSHSCDGLRGPDRHQRLQYMPLVDDLDRQIAKHRVDVGRECIFPFLAALPAAPGRALQRNVLPSAFRKRCPWLRSLHLGRSAQSAPMFDGVYRRHCWVDGMDHFPAFSGRLPRLSKTDFAERSQAHFSGLAVTTVAVDPATPPPPIRHLEP